MNKVQPDYVVHWVQPLNGALRIIEEAQGASLLDVFGFECGIHSVIIAPEDAQHAAEALGSQGAELSKALDAFFTGKGNMLSDVMDVLDRAQTVYTYEPMQENRSSQT